MPELVAILDTSVFCCWLEVPGRTTAGSGSSKWDTRRSHKEVDRVIKAGGTIILPNAVIIETANMIASADHSRRLKAETLLDRVLGSLDGVHPWQRFDESDRLWTREWYRSARDEWPSFADQRIGLADYSIISIARFFTEMRLHVEALTADESLGNAVSAMSAPSTRRRSR